jgi:hypothetical protein
LKKGRIWAENRHFYGLLWGVFRVFLFAGSAVLGCAHHLDTLAGLTVALHNQLCGNVV